MALTRASKQTFPSKKRLAGHHRQGKDYLKAYLPYLPMLMIIGLGLVINSLWTSSSQVLGASSDFSDSSMISSVNKYRERSNLQDLQLNSKLDAAAQSKAEHMASRNYWAHIAPDGKTPWIFIAGNGYNYTVAAENLAYGFDNSNAVVIGWMNSPEHKANLLNADFQDIGFGVVSAQNYNGKGPQIIVVAILAKPSNGQVMGAMSVPGPNSTSISRIQLFTKGNAMWSAIALSAITGALLAVFVIRHGIGIRKYVKRSERYIMKHPKLDLLVVVVITVGILLTRSSGSIY